MSSSLDSLVDDRVDLCDLIRMNHITSVNVTDAATNDSDVNWHPLIYIHVKVDTSIVVNFIVALFH